MCNYIQYKPIDDMDKYNAMLGLAKVDVMLMNHDALISFEF